MARQRIEIDFKLLEGMCQIQCTIDEISSILKASVCTIQRRIKEEYGLSFDAYYKKNSASGRMSLRRAQFKAAISGNPAMLIWLGKQNLGQKDRPADETETADTSPVSVVIQVEDCRKNADQSHSQ